jgi:hypothetical protein
MPLGKVKPPAKPATRGRAASQSNQPPTEGSSRGPGSLSPTLEVQEVHEIKDARGGRKFLEHHLLLCPEGEPATHLSLAMCLAQVAAMNGVTKPARNVIRSVTLLLIDLEDTKINGMVKEAFNSQITEYAQDMKALIEHAKDQIVT